MRKLIFLLTLVLFGCKHMGTNNSKLKYGTVIILNGPSASGKTSIQKAFQNLKMPQLWLKIGIDNLFDSPMPEITKENLSYWQKENNIRWVTSSKDEDGNNIVALHVGSDGEKAAYGMNSAIASYAKNGCNIIVDYIAYKKEWLDDLKMKLAYYKTIYVAVDISLEELEKREALRKTSPVGHARSHYDQIYWDANYDLRVDSEKYSAEEIAKQISWFIDMPINL